MMVWRCFLVLTVIIDAAAAAAASVNPNSTQNQAGPPQKANGPPPAPAFIGLAAPARPDLNSCQPGRPCTKPNTECVEGNCVCKPDYVLTADGTCTKSPRLGDSCRVNGEVLTCSGFGVEYSCPANGSAVCVCSSGYEPGPDKSCKPAVRLVGAVCAVDGDCTASFSSCRSGKCACIDGFKTGGKEGVWCHPIELRCMGDGKPLEQSGQPVPCQSSVSAEQPGVVNDTCPSGYACYNWQDSYAADRALTGHCCPPPSGPNITTPCPVGVPHPTGKCIDQSKVPADAPLPPELGPFCPLGDYECFLGSTCCPVACRSSSSHFNHAGLCYDHVPLDGKCDIDVQCVTDAQCKGGTCQCRAGYKKASAGYYCEAVEGSNPDSSGASADMAVVAAPAMARSVKSGNDQTKSQSEASAVVGLPAPGGPDLSSCSLANPCTNPNTECVDSNCLCKSGYIPVSNGTCFKSPELGDPCKVGDQDFVCSGFGVAAMCPVNGSARCECQIGYEKKGNACRLSVRLVGSSCSVDGDCTAAFTVCQSGRCTCIEGFQPRGKDGLCVPSELRCPGNSKALERKGQPIMCEITTENGGIPNDTCPTDYACLNWQDSYTAGHALVGHCCPRPPSDSNITFPCPIGVPHPSGKCVDPSKVPADAPIPPEFGPLCPLGEGYGCYLGACCPVACRASSSHFNYAGRCYDYVLLDGSCEIDAQCLPKAQCRSGTCQCVPGYKKTTPTSCDPEEGSGPPPGGVSPEMSAPVRSEGAIAPSGGLVPAPAPAPGGGAGAGPNPGPSADALPLVPPPPAPGSNLQKGGGGPSAGPESVPSPISHGERECGEEKSCPDPTKTCIDGHCLCSEEYLNDGSGSCFKAPQLGAPCRVKGQEVSCYGYGVEDSCPEKGLCVCKAGYQPNANGTCSLTLLKVGDACKVDADCTVAFAGCVRGKCSCIEGFKSDGKGYCIPTEYHCVGNDKPLDKNGQPVKCSALLTETGDIINGTCPPTFFCNAWQNTFGSSRNVLSGHCCPISNDKVTSCPVGMVHKTHKCADYSNVPPGQPLPPPPDPLCPLGQGYDCYQGRICCPSACRSSNVPTNVEGRCYDNVRVRQLCHIDTQCVDGAECRGGICECKEGYTNISSSSCVPKDLVQPGPPPAGQPVPAPAGASSEPVIAPKSGPSALIRSGVTGGSPAGGSPAADSKAVSCSQSKPCTDPQRACIDGVCMCAGGLTSDETGECVKNWAELDEGCRMNGKELYCQGFGVDPTCPPDNICACEHGHVKVDEKSCKIADRAVGSSCKVDGDCTLAFARCQSGKCECIEGFKSYGGRCTPTDFRCYDNDKALEKGGKTVMCAVSITDGGRPVNDTCPSTHYCNYWQNTYTASGSLAGHCCPKPSGKDSNSTCPVGVAHKTGQCPDLSRFPADAPLPRGLGPMCPLGGGYECLHGSVCCPLPCLASGSHFHVNGRCYDHLILDQPCDIDAQCLPRSACIGGTCKCKPGYVKESPTLCAVPGEFPWMG